MNRTIKEATVKRYHNDAHRQLERHLTDFIAAYNYARRLKTLRGLTPYEFICKAWGDEPHRFTTNPHHQSLGPNTSTTWQIRAERVRATGHNAGSAWAAACSA